MKVSKNSGKGSLNKYILSGAVVALFGAYAIYSKTQDKNAAILPDTSAGVEATNATASTTATSAGTAATRTYRDGTYTGKVTDAFYGDYQVAAIIKDGRLSDITFIQSPRDSHESIEINRAVMPILRSEAIQAQSSKVDIVSGATQSSEAFSLSLADALSQAQSS